MSEASAQPKPRRRRRWLQFSLRSMLLLTTLASVGMWWYLRPEPLERLLPDGMKLRVPVFVAEDLAVNPLTGKKDSNRHGPFVVLDRYGRTLAKGYYDNDRPAGHWTYYHSDGRKALAGPCIAGCRTGVWTAWDERGRKRAEVEHGEPVVAFHNKTILLLGGELPKVAVRQGAARDWWDNARPRSEGNFQHDRAHGPWVLSNRDGVNIAAGEFRNGERDGRWTFADEKSQPTRERQFVHGRETPKIEKLLPELEQQLQSDDWRVRHDAVTALAVVGREGVPLLVKTLETNDAGLRMLALESLAQLGPEAKSALANIETLTHHADASTRFEAMLAHYRLAVDDRPAIFKRLMTTVVSSTPDMQTRQTKRLADFGWPFMDVGMPFVVELESSLNEGAAPERYLALAVIASMRAKLANSSYSPDDLALDNKLEAILEKAKGHADPRVSNTAQRVLDCLLPGPPSHGCTSIIPIVG